MFTFETADQKEVRRLRIAQFNGRPTTVSTDGTAITGHVRSIQEQESGAPQRWTITIIPSPPKDAMNAATPLLRPAPRVHSLSEDFC